MHLYNVVRFPFPLDSNRAPQYQHRYPSPRPAIKMESNQSGQSYRSNQSAQGSMGFKRSPSTSSNLNPFRKSQRLYHLNAVPSPNDPGTVQFDGKSNDELYYEEACPRDETTSGDCPSQPNDQLISEEAFGNTDEVNFMTDASLAFHT